MSEDIRNIEQRLRQLAEAFAQLDRLRPERDQAVIEASRLGLTRRRVAALAGITAGRVQQILDDANNQQ